MKSTVLLTLAMAFVAAPAFADGPRLTGLPAKLLSGDAAQLTTHEVPTPPVSSIKAGPLAVELEVTTLADVQKQFGGTISNATDGGVSVDWVCYVIQRTSGAGHIWFLSDGRIGGPDHVVTMVASDFDLSEHSGCTDAPASLTAIDYSVPGLLTSESDVVARFGPTDALDNVVSYSNQTTSTTTPLTTLQVLSYHFKDGKVDAIAVNQLTTN
ncbi:hypothetical protein OSH11_00305 [Kaistia dalseonensis]|uniref:Secreted protein n=1 Tax=Kaistia dalseonensis TaxID=410840 RepID=A0ABU0H095_9HYPH|nr:hypothetical protein [Kaistia dalseonensis]MCX5493137.1 hypothetical protein [Kaistia dalseonensis]MDQ0435692.1 hypothetical protein [Kaistia dalseonensis]